MTPQAAQLADEVAKQVADAPNRLAAMERAVATLKAAIPHYAWVGIYLLDGDEHLSVDLPVVVTFRKVNDVFIPYFKVFQDGG